MQKSPQKEIASRQQILVFCPLYPPHIGGLESHAEQWNEEMARTGYSITVWTPHIAGGATQEEKNGVNIFRFPAWELIANYPVPKFWHPLFWRQWREIATTLKARPIIVSRTRFFLTSLMALTFAKVSKKHWLHIEHGSDFVQLTNRLPRTLARLYDYTFGRLVLRQADAVVANSKASAAFVQQLSGRSVDAVVYRGINGKEIAKIPAAAKLPVPTITYVGRLISSKGVQDLITALPMIKESKWHCWIIGDGPQRPVLERQAWELGIADRVSFLGEKPWEETIAHMKASHIIVNPSYTEGLPTSVIEAVIAGIPVIATDVGGTTEVISSKQDGILVPPHNISALLEALNRLLSHSIRQAIKAPGARNLASERFSWQFNAEAYQKIIKN
ncbi:MAG: glycosyltransferase family 4 protein [Candidatus Andersenbacteria bacterium]